MGLDAQGHIMAAAGVMAELPGFEIVEGRAEFRPVGSATLHEAIQSMKSAIILARERRAAKLLAVMTGLAGYKPPRIGMRYFLANELAAAAGGALRVALVTRPEMIDPWKFGVTAAANAGLIAEVFVREDEALAWLRGQD